jgi:hypothetical protein
LVKRIIFSGLIIHLVFSTSLFAEPEKYPARVSGEYTLQYVHNDTSMDAAQGNELSYFEHEFLLQIEIRVRDNLILQSKMEYASSSFGDGDHALGESSEIKAITAFFKAEFKYLTMKGGKFEFTLPAEFDGSPLLEDEGTGFELELGDFLLGMLRAEDAKDATEDTYDIFYLNTGFKTEDISLNIYTAYSAASKGVTESGIQSNGFWIGYALELKTGSLGIISDFVYGSRSDFEIAGQTESGFFLDFEVRFETERIMPVAFLIFSSGNDNDERDIEVMPLISPEFEPLNGFGRVNDEVDYLSGLIGLAVGFRELSIIPQLEHDLIVFFASGTNHIQSDAAFTESDSAMEVDFNSRYELDEEFEIFANLTYVALHLDEDIHGPQEKNIGTYIEIGLELKFD